MKYNLKLIKKFFQNYDIRWKLLILGKHLRFKIYPDYLENKGIKKIFFWIIFNLIYFEKTRKKKKQFLEEIKIITNNSNEKVNFLISSPSSGGNYVRYLISSHFEIYYKIGNGIPKFNNLSNKFIFSASPILSGDIFNFIELEKNINNFKFFSKEEFNKKKVILSRYPYPSQNLILKPNLFKVNSIRPIILFRDAFDWLQSRYSWRENKSFTNNNQIDEKLILSQISDYIKYIKFWLEYTNTNNSKNYLLLDFKTLTNNEKKSFLKILEFLNYEILDDEILDKIISVNSKEYAKKDLGVEFRGTRFTDDHKKKITKNKIYDYCKNQKEFIKLEKYVNDLKERVVV